MILLGTEGGKIEGTGVGDTEEEIGKSAEGGSDMERGRTSVGVVEAVDGGT